MQGPSVRGGRAEQDGREEAAAAAPSAAAAQPPTCSISDCRPRLGVDARWESAVGLTSSTMASRLESSAEGVRKEGS